MSSTSGSSTSGSSSSSSSDEEEVWTGNEGDSSDCGEEAPADASQRGSAALVTAACPRKYPRELEVRRRNKNMIPEDFGKEVFLKNFRGIFNRNATAKLDKAACYDEPHKRYRPSARRRERHYHIAIKTSGNFAHKKVAAAFFKAYGVRISFSFKLKRFVGNLKYLMTPGKKPSTDLDLAPARYPPNLDIEAELRGKDHPGEADEVVVEGRKRKRLTFDEISNIVIEGVGQGPIRTGMALEEAARSLKLQGKVELWNCLGEKEKASDINNLVCRVWRLNGSLIHHMWRTSPTFPLDDFDHSSLELVQDWIREKHKTHTLVLSGDGGLKKTSLAEALIHLVSPGGFWFLDDPDDLRELEGQIQPGHGLLVDEIEMSSWTPNQIKKLFDVVKSRRIKCRHINGSLPKGCPRIFCTNSEFDGFYPKMKNKQDRTGVFRRQLFQVVVRDLKKVSPMLTAPLPLVASGDEEAIVTPGSANRLQGLRDVMAMQREGLLDAEEFKAAKRALLGL